MHRSGVAMIAEVLRACGLSIANRAGNASPVPSPDPADSDRFLQLNDELLDELGAGWDCPPPISSPWSQEERFFPLKTKAQLILQKFAGAEPWGWHDPCCSFTLPFWNGLLPKLKTVICLRSPLEVALSLHQRNCSLALALSLWATYNERLLHATTRAERLITHFDAYFHQPEVEIHKLLAFLNIRLPEAAIRQAAQTVRWECRQHRFTTGHMLDARLSTKVVGVYMQMCAEAGWVDERARRGSPSQGAAPATLLDGNGSNAERSESERSKPGLKTAAADTPGSDRLGRATVAVGHLNKVVVEAELLRRQLDLLRPQFAVQSGTRDQPASVEGPAPVRGATEPESRLEELAKERDTAFAEAADLRAFVKRMSEREKELRQMLLEAHDRLFRQDEAFMKSLTGPLQGQARPAGTQLPPDSVIAEEVDRDDTEVAGFAIDRVSEPTADDAIEVSGWVLGRRSAVIAVELLGTEGSVCRAPVNLLRPDIRAIHPDLPGAERSGFEMTFPVHELITEHRLVLQAVLPDETRISLAVIRLKKSSRKGGLADATGNAVPGLEHPPMPAQADPAKLLQYRMLIERTREVLSSKVPLETTVLVVSKGDDGLLQVDGRRTRHFPQDEQGRYAGYHPADSGAAIQHLEALHAQGAEYLLFPSTAFWWLDHYADFAKHLEGSYRRIFADEHCILFQLGNPAA